VIAIKVKDEIMRETLKKKNSWNYPLIPGIFKREK